MSVPKNQHHPSPEERDERVKVALDPDEFIEGVTKAGPPPDEEHGEESKSES